MHVLGVTKIDPRAIRCRLVGYTSLGKQYVVWIPVTDEVKHARDVVFKEGSDPDLYGDPDDDYGKFVNPPAIPPSDRNPNEVASDDDSDQDIVEGRDPTTPDPPRPEDSIPTPQTRVEVQTLVISSCYSPRLGDVQPVADRQIRAFEQHCRSQMEPRHRHSCNAEKIFLVYLCEERRRGLQHEHN